MLDINVSSVEYISRELPDVNEVERTVQSYALVNTYGSQRHAFGSV